MTCSLFFRGDRKAFDKTRFKNFRPNQEILNEFLNEDSDESQEVSPEHEPDVQASPVINSIRKRVRNIGMKPSPKEAKSKRKSNGSCSGPKTKKPGSRI